MRRNVYKVYNSWCRWNQKRNILEFWDSFESKVIWVYINNISKQKKKLNPWEVKILWFAQLLTGMQLRLNGLKPFFSCYCSLRVLWFCEEFIFSLSTIGPILGKDSIRFSLETKERFGCRFQILLNCYCFYIYLYLYIL